MGEGDAGAPTHALVLCPLALISIKDFDLAVQGLEVNFILKRRTLSN